MIYSHFGAFQVLEACMNHCGKRFHSEAAKFRFLNELIKVLTPKVMLFTVRQVLLQLETKHLWF